jgi:hypothetical protein
VQYQAHPQAAVARELRKYSQAGEALGIWGFMPNFYVEAGLRQATRDAHSQAEILDSPYYDYFRERYLADLEHSVPPVFIDAMTPSNATESFVFHHGLLRFETVFPKLADYIRTRYTQVDEVQSVRIYVRNDRLKTTYPRFPQNQAP